MILELVHQTHCSPKQQPKQENMCFIMHVPANKTGLIIGKKGVNIRKICQESGANVEMLRNVPHKESETVFSIQGNRQQIQAAQQMIRIKLGEIPAEIPALEHKEEVDQDQPCFCVKILE
jgi:polyribonucleotide nucleotidyltransferase